jgi:hypothetical protein
MLGRSGKGSSPTIDGRTNAVVEPLDRAGGPDDGFGARGDANPPRRVVHDRRDAGRMLGRLLEHRHGMLDALK